MKAVKTTLEGVTYYLVLNGEAMFQIRDSFDSTKLLLEAMQKDTREGFKATCAAAVHMYGSPQSYWSAFQPIFPGYSQNPDSAP